MPTFYSADHTPLAYNQYGSGAPLILVHGTNGSQAHWNLVLPFLTPHFSVYTLDRRGRGQSGDGPEYAIEREFEDIAALANSIDTPVSILGHSFGAGCVLGALPLITRLQRAILYEPPMLQEQQSPQRGMVLDNMEQMLARGERDQVVISMLRDMLGMPAAMIERIQSLPNWSEQLGGADTIPRELRQSHRYAPDLAALETIQTPILFLLGENSPAFFRMTTETLRAHLPNSQAVTLPGQQHSAMLTAPQLFADQVIAFCAVETIL